MSNDVDRRRNFLTRRAPLLASVGTAAGVGIAALLAKPLDLDIGDIFVGIAGPLVSVTINGNIASPGAPAQRSVSDGLSMGDAATTSTFMALKPASFDALVHREEFNDTLWTTTPTTEEGYYNRTYAGVGPGNANTAGAGMYFNMDGGTTGSGGTLTGFSVTDMVIDSMPLSIAAAEAIGMISPPWMHEARYWAGTTGVYSERLDYDEGNGPGATANPDPLWYSFVMCYADAGGCGGIGDDILRCADDGFKIAFFKVGGTQVLLDTLADTNSPIKRCLFVFNLANPDQPGCNLLYGNLGYVSGDTLNTNTYPDSGDNCSNVSSLFIIPYGEFFELWFCIDDANGIVAGGIGDQQYMYYTGVNIPSPVAPFRFNTTYGGADVLENDASLFRDHAEWWTPSGAGSCPVGTGGPG